VWTRCAAIGYISETVVRVGSRKQTLVDAYKLSKLRMSACEYEAPKTFLSPARLASRLLLEDEVRQKGDEDLIELSALWP
jgi:hypothetical protein